MWKHVKGRKNRPQWQPQKPHNQVKNHRRHLHIHAHICGLNGHEMIDCPKFVEIQKVFHEKYVVITEVQPIVETQTIITNVNVVDVNVTTRSKVIEKNVLKDRELKKTKSVVDWEKEEWLKKSMVGTIQ